MRTIQAAAAGRAVLVAGCNAGATRQSVALATAARDLGYDALMLAAPATSFPQQHELAAHFVAVADAADLPTILYNYPARAGVEIGLRVPGPGGRTSADRGPQGVERGLLAPAHGPPPLRGRLTIMCGSDDQAADYFFWGVRGWLAGTANVLPRQHVEILEAANCGDLDTRPRASSGASFPGCSTWRPAPTTRRRSSVCAISASTAARCGRPSCPSATGPRPRWSSVLDARTALMPPRATRRTAAVEVHAEGEQGTCYLGSPFDVPGRTAAGEAPPPQLRRRHRPADAHPGAPRPTTGQRQPGVPSTDPGPMRASSSSRRTGRTP